MKWSYLRIIKPAFPPAPRTRSGRSVLGMWAGSCALRWSTTRSSKVNLPHAIDFRAICGAKLVTLRSKFEATNPTNSTFWSGGRTCNTRPDPRENNALGRGHVLSMFGEHVSLIVIEVGQRLNQAPASPPLNPTLSPPSRDVRTFRPRI